MVGSQFFGEMAQNCALTVDRIEPNLVVGEIYFPGLTDWSVCSVHQQVMSRSAVFGGGLLWEFCKGSGY